MTPTEIIFAAATKLNHLAASAYDSTTMEGWHAEDCAQEKGTACPCIVAQGRNQVTEDLWVPESYVADCETPEIAAYVAVMNPVLGMLLSKLLYDCAQVHEPNICLKHEGCQEHALGCQWCADEDFPCQDFRNCLAIAMRILDLPGEETKNGPRQESGAVN